MFDVLSRQPNRLLKADNLFSSPLFPRFGTHCAYGVDLWPASRDNARILTNLLSIQNGFPGACAGKRWGRPSATSRSSRRLPSRPTGRSSPVSIRSTRPTRACSVSYGGVTAALNRAVEGQPAAEGGSFQVVIDGEPTGQSHRLMEARFGCAYRGLVADPGV